MDNALIDLVEGTLMEMYNDDMSDVELLEEMMMLNV